MILFESAIYRFRSINELSLPKTYLTLKMPKQTVKISKSNPQTTVQRPEQKKEVNKQIQELKGKLKLVI